MQLLLQPEDICILSHAAKVTCAGNSAPLFHCAGTPDRFSLLNSVKIRQAWGESPQRSVWGSARGFTCDGVVVSAREWRWCGEGCDAALAQMSWENQVIRDPGQPCARAGLCIWWYKEGFKAKLRAQLHSIVCTCSHKSRSFMLISQSIISQRSLIRCLLRRIQWFDFGASLSRKTELYKHVPQHKGLFPARLAHSLPGSHLPPSAVFLQHFGGVGWFPQLLAERAALQSPWKQFGEF